MRATRGLVIGGLLLLLAGCSTTTVNFGGGLPDCTTPAGDVNGAMVLQAQAVPTASWLPCLRSLPLGWSFDQLNAHNGAAEFSLDSDRDGTHALTVTLQPACDVRGAMEVPSEQQPLRRYERVLRLQPSYSGLRYYVFQGGCVRYRFNLHGNSRAEPVAIISDALGFIPRDQLRLAVERRTHGLISLDPPHGSDAA